MERNVISPDLRLWRWLTRRDSTSPVPSHASSVIDPQLGGGQTRSTLDSISYFTCDWLEQDSQRGIDNNTITYRNGHDSLAHSEAVSFQPLPHQ